MSGKTAISQEVTSGDVIGGNRIMVKTASLPAPTP